MEKLLKQLGFYPFTGNLYKHDILGIMQIDPKDSPNDLVQKIYNRGFGECQELIKANLGIKP